MNKDKPALPNSSVNGGTLRREKHFCAVSRSGQQRALSKSMLTFLCAFVIIGCTPTTPGPKPTRSIIPLSEAIAAQGGSQVYNLSPSERRMCEKRAAKGDVVAAKQLVEYHEMVTKDLKQYHHWLMIVARLERTQHRKQ
jgi:hypothetical protein